MGEIRLKCKSYIVKTVVKIRKLESNIRLLQFVRSHWIRLAIDQRHYNRQLPREVIIYFIKLNSISINPF